LKKTKDRREPYREKACDQKNRKIISSLLAGQKGGGKVKGRRITIKSSPLRVKRAKKSRSDQQDQKKKNTLCPIGTTEEERHQSSQGGRTSITLHTRPAYFEGRGGAYAEKGGAKEKLKCISKSRFLFAHNEKMLITRGRGKQECLGHSKKESIAFTRSEERTPRS